MSDACRDSINKRKSFAKVQSIIPLPNLIEVQSNSFNDFAQLDCLPVERKNIGLEKIFRNIFPIDYLDKMTLQYIGYEIGKWECVCGNLSGIEKRYTWECDSCEKKDVSRLSKNKECTSCKKNTARYKTCPLCLTRVKIKAPLTIAECRSTSQTFSLPLKVRVQLFSWEKEEGSDKKIIRDVKEQEIFLLDLPVMGDIYEEKDVFKLGSNGTFIVNGVERVVVSQIHRSPGVVFSQGKKNKDSFNSSGFIARIIPMRGSWIDFEIDNKDVLYVRIDKAKKVLATTFLQALGIERDEIIKLFYKFINYTFKNGVVNIKLDENSIGTRIEKGMLPKAIESSYLNKKVTKELIKELKKDKIESLVLRKSSILNKTIGKNVFDVKTGELIVEQGTVLTESIYSQLSLIENLDFSLISTSGYVLNPVIPLTLSLDKFNDINSAAKEVYSKIYVGESAPIEEIKNRIMNLFFNSKFYDLTTVGRVKINRKLGLSISEDICHLTKEDIIETIKYLVGLRERGEGEFDDIDHLGNRRVRLVGELLMNQFYSGMLRVEKIIRERFRIYDSNKSLSPYDLINVKPLAGIVREFFTTGQLSQFMDQTNPLAEIAHKRKLSSLGPGGVLKERATYEVRDVHTSHYGRICPIETPEGQSIGLISSLSTLASVNELGLIETPYRPVIDGVVQDEVVNLDAFEESNVYIAQVEVLKDGNNLSPEKKVLARYQGNFVYVDREKIQYIDLSPNQVFSVATSLIPFLQHDDAVRALMGSNMQRQAVPLLKAEPPIVGTGMEKDVAKATGACIISKHNGTVEYVSNEKIIVRADRDQFGTDDDWITDGIDTYKLRVFEGSSYNTCIHQTPIVKVGDRIKAGEIISNATAVVDGELSLGKNLTVAFMPWRGYNYEDAIIVNKRIVTENLLTSIQIEEYTVDARDTRLGAEEITADIPNIPASALSFLDQDGIVKIGTRVKPGDILVGKVTLKGDVQHSPEEKLLRAIFGEKSRDVKDTSLRVPAGVEGIIVDVKVFSKSGSRNDDRYKMCVAVESEKLKKEYAMQKKLLESMVREKIIELAENESGSFVYDKKNKEVKSFGLLELKGLTDEEIFTLKLKSLEKQKNINDLKEALNIQLKVLEGLHKEKLVTLRKGDVLPSGVLKMVKVYIASVRNLKVGDKISGRHGNKGVVSLIVPQEDMPYMEDGTPVDIILNPMGVPSRMNLGQILEIILGFAGKKIGKDFAEMINSGKQEFLKNETEKIFGKDFVKMISEKCGKDSFDEICRKISKEGLKFAVPVFDSGNFNENIKPILEKEGMSISGTYKLRDGITGEYFDQSVTVGIMYIMKLNHMVDDKLHARCVGPYSLVTQQPLGGKSQMGGQRFGEMEVWALEAYGAAYTLQELLTYKSDDVNGRHRVYDALVRGEDVPNPGMPESFNVLVKELQSLALKVDLVEEHI